MSKKGQQAPEKSNPSVGMKTVVLVRHAKSSWDDFSIKDFDRPLNDRGKRDAPAMAQRLLHRKVVIDAFVSSPAKRARRTTEHFASAYDRDKKEIIFIDSLYLATPEMFYEVISKLSDEFQHVAIFSHNNGITDFANQLTDVKIDEIPTTGIFAIKVHANHWKDFREAAKDFWFFDSPKSK